MIPTIILAQLLSSFSPDDARPYIDDRHPEWNFVEKKYWLAVRDKGTAPAGSQNCPLGDMIEINGFMNVYGPDKFFHDAMENLQKTACKKWSEKKESCVEFDQSKWEKIEKNLSKKQMHFCIDPYEWPNREGAVPWVMVTWEESKALCESKGKRLCSEEEWTFACEGESALPLPNGYNRDPQKCNIDKEWKPYDGRRMFPRGTEASGKELNRLWQGYVSGSRKDCASPFGIHDMLGNVEELTAASRPNKYKSILKGGYWAGRKSQCRSSIRSHGELHTFYQQGFRCCADHQEK